MLQKQADRIEVMVIDVSGVGGTKLPTHLAGVCTLLALVAWTLGGYRAFEQVREGLVLVGISGYFDALNPDVQPQGGFPEDFDASDPAALVLFPEMDEIVDVPEITTACWDILNVDPDAMMCATSRMVVKRRGTAYPVVLPCTLLPYDPQFEMGATLAGARAPVWLNHRHCAKFCVLGGGSCGA